MDRRRGGGEEGRGRNAIHILNSYIVNQILEMFY